MGDFLMRWAFGLRVNNNVRLYTCYVLTGLLFFTALFTGGFNEPFGFS